MLYVVVKILCLGFVINAVEKQLIGQKNEMIDSLTLVLSLLLLGIVSYAQKESTPWPKQLEKYLQLEQKRLGFQGVCLVAKGEEILFHQAFGKASIELDVNMETTHRFKVASISKSFTAQLIGMAEQEGLLHLSDPVHEYLPQIKGGAWMHITIEQLLTHTSGIPHHEGMKDYWSVVSRLELTKAEILTRIRSMELRFEPGKSMHYSSPGYFLLACILEQVYQRNYAEIWQQKIGDPLDLHASGIYDHQNLIPQFTAAYHLKPDDQLIPTPYRNHATLKGGGDLYSSTLDLWRWNKQIVAAAKEGGFAQKTFLAQNAIQAKGKAGTFYGYGWFIRKATADRPTAYYHGGGTFGYSAMSAVYPAKDLNIILLSNVSRLPMELIWQNVEALVSGIAIDLPKLVKPKTLLPTDLARYVGQYQSSTSTQTLRVFIHETQLYAQLSGRPPFILTAVDQAVFYGEKVDISFTFLAGAAGEITRLRAEGRGRQFSFERKE